MPFIPLNAGDLDQVVALLAPTIVEDETGQRTEFQAVASVAAAVEPLRGREFFAAGATQNAASLRVSIWWRADVLSSWRLSWMGRVFELVADPIDVAGRHRTLELMCVAVAK